MIDDDEIDRSIAWLVKNAETSAQSRAERLYLEQYLKTVKAELMSASGESAVSAQEAWALRNPKYKETLDAYKTSIYADEKQRFLTSAAETKIEAWRTQCSNNRAQGRA